MTAHFLRETDNVSFRSNFTKIIEKICHIERKQNHPEKVKIAFVNCKNDIIGYEKNIRGDELLAFMINEQNPNYIVHDVAWEDALIEWSKFHLVILRGCHNYIYHINEFELWLDYLEKMKVPVLNSVNVVKQNMKKTYLRNLEEKGLPKEIKLPKTWWLEEFYKDATFNLKEELKKRGFKRGVVKPIIGCDSDSQWCFSTSDLIIHDESQLRMQSGIRSGVMIQEYVDAIDTAWEVDLIFIARSFSHAVVRSPSHGPNSGEEEVYKCIPNERLVEAASKVLQLVEGELLYARVDVVIDNGNGSRQMGEQDGVMLRQLDPEGVAYLMEVELIEPTLFFDDKTAKHFGNVIEKIIQEAKMPLHIYS